MKYDLTVIDRIENPGSEDSLIIGLKPERLVHLLQNDIQVCQADFFTDQKSRRLRKNIGFWTFDPEREYWFQTIGHAPRSVSEAVEQLSQISKIKKCILGFSQMRG